MKKQVQHINLVGNSSISATPSRKAKAKVSKPKARKEKGRSVAALRRQGRSRR